MKKVLFLINSLEGGGAEKVLTTLTNNLCENYDITIMTIYNEGLYIKQLNDRINYKSIIKKPTLNKKRIMFRLLKYLPAKLLHKIFIKDHYDIEVGFLEGICTKIVSAADNSTKKIGWIHLNLELIKKKNWEFINKNLAKKCYDSLNHIICVSEDVKQSYINRIGSNNEALVIYNPIDAEDIINKSKSPIVEINNDKFTISAIGRLVPQKGFDRLIAAIVNLKNEGYNFRLWIIGEGHLRDSLQKQITDNSVEEFITLIGFKENVYPYLASSDLYICSSRNEGYSLTVAEALVLGIPVISTNCSGPIELLDGGKYGKLVENSTDGIYSGIKSVLDNQKLLKDMQLKAQERGSTFNLEKTIKDVKELFD